MLAEDIHLLQWLGQWGQEAVTGTRGRVNKALSIMLHVPGWWGLYLMAVTVTLRTSERTGLQLLVALVWRGA